MRQSNKTPRICPSCGTTFYYYPRKDTLREQKHCSRQCSRPKPVPVECSCLSCGKKFFAASSRIKSGHGKYCSKLCRSAGDSKFNPARFWKRVDKSGDCWLWTGDHSRYGYGLYRNAAGQKTGAHRVSWELHNGTIPDGLFVCHNCPGGDNPLCVNPAHLFLGTNADNMADCVQKGRTRIGERHWNSRFTEEQVTAIRQRYAAGGISVRKLAEELGEPYGTISAIIYRVSWKHLP